MAGHSKWANIKHRKGAQDAKRAKLFTKLIKEVAVATKEGGPDPDANPRLRMAIKNARKASVPKDRIEGAISKGSGNDGTTWDDVTFEGYAPNGIAVFVEALTDNNNRTVANVRSYFNKYNGSMGKSGSVDYMFERKGIFIFPMGSHDEEELTMELLDGGLEDIENDGENFIATCAFEDYGNLNAKIEELGIDAESSLNRIPSTTLSLDVEAAKSVLKLIDIIEDDDDVQQVFHNMEMTDEILESM
ncbi:YebC/PmpR family DNA-binding transcriptional regulator [Pontibacter sp. G13]|uniref:YebC/PmpR family DNA-binding transcriptional regulator n=1 Tax=Pontibacter sp. G13 TaxID=3074898 RepID=UPI00288A4E18|nr:YebC/PmpR family DNA-binding transcriptional regulator [Pontibacter sp. G13]WNJ20413.1 YebC/PmpR family DNA-binding transcriptional regulator [Pontibacter sp. G13]